MSDYESKLNSNFDAFNFKILCLLVCRGDIKTKAGLLFDIVDNGSVVNFVPGKGRAKSSVIWSSKRLKHAITQLIMFSELLPKLFYHRLKSDIPDDFNNLLQENSKNSTMNRDAIKSYKYIV
mgnify:CR=1 FL=1